MMWLLNWFSGGIVGQIGKQLNAAYATKANAKNTTERIAADTLIVQLEARQAVLVAEQGHWFTRMVRPLWALPFVVFTWKVVVWDKVMGLGVTDPLGPEEYNLMAVIAGAYFLGRTAEKITQTINRK